MLGDFLITIGYIFTLGSGLLLQRKNKKKPIIANSTMETKLIAFASVSEEVRNHYYYNG